jgi:predicted ATPase
MSIYYSADPSLDLATLKGLDQLSRLPENNERDHHELDLQMALGSILATTAGYAAPAVGKTYARARQLCTELDRPLELAILLNGQCVYHMLAGDLILASKEAQEIKDLGETRNNTIVKLVGIGVSAIVQFHLGDFTRTKTHAERRVDLA